MISNYNDIKGGVVTVIDRYTVFVIPAAQSSQRFQTLHPRHFGLPEAAKIFGFKTD